MVLGLVSILLPFLVTCSYFPHTCKGVLHISTWSSAAFLTRRYAGPLPRCHTETYFTVVMLGDVKLCPIFHLAAHDSFSRRADREHNSVFVTHCTLWPQSGGLVNCQAVDCEGSAVAAPALFFPQQSIGRIKYNILLNWQSNFSRRQRRQNL